MMIIESIPADSFPDWLKSCIEKDSRRAEVIAVEADISAGYLYKLMGGRTDTVSREVVSRLEAVLGAKFDGN